MQGLRGLRSWKIATRGAQRVTGPQERSLQDVASEPASGAEAAELPFVSIIVPAYNEERHIQGCLDSLLHQDYPRDRYEILVVDGKSTDRSLEVIQSICAEETKVRVLLNAGRMAARALNIGLAQARGEIIVRMDAHARAPEDYLSSCVRCLLEEGVDHVGGIMQATGSGYWGETIALGTSSPFGVGGSKHRCASCSGYEEPGWLGAFRKDTLLMVGGFDEGVGCNEDDDLSYRLLKAGRRYFLNQQIRITYFCRDSLSKLFVQYFRYGYWKIEVIRRYGRLTALRHIVPAVFLCFVLAAGTAAVFHPSGAQLLRVLLSMYVTLGAAQAVALGAKAGLRYVFALPLVFATLHLAYGAGFLFGTARYVCRRALR
jgi:succinoglycan biosynthesis protein ExoA